MSEQRCSCLIHPWQFYRTGERAEYPGGEKGCKFWSDLWQRVNDDIGLAVDQHRADEDGEFYCDRCGSQLHRDGTATPQVPWARAEQAEKRCQAHRSDANLFTALRHILAFNDGVFLLKDDDGRIVVGVPVETICYAKVGEGWDEREAVMAAYEQHKKTPPCEREVVRT